MTFFLTYLKYFHLSKYKIDTFISNSLQTYDSSDDEIDRTCVSKARDMMFKLVIAKNYQESSSKLRLKITSEVKVHGMHAYWKLVKYLMHERENIVNIKLVHAIHRLSFSVCLKSLMF